MLLLILKLIIESADDHGVDQINLAKGMAGSCEHSNESLVSIKCREFLSLLEL